MVIETHGSAATIERTARVLAGLVRSGKLFDFVHEIDDRGSVWDAVCRLEEGVLAEEGRNRWSGGSAGWRIVVGLADGLEEVPAYLGWGHARVWLEHDESVLTIEAGYGVHVFDRELFDALHDPAVVASAPFCDRSAELLNAGWAFAAG